MFDVIEHRDRASPLDTGNLKFVQTKRTLQSKWSYLPWSVVLQFLSEIIDSKLVLTSPLNG